MHFPLNVSAENAKKINRVFGILTHYERDAQKVEDLAQDTFLKVWRNLKQYLGKSPFEHWLSRIASNVARDHLRRIQRRIRETSFEGLGEGSIDWLSTRRMIDNILIILTHAQLFRCS